MKKLLLFPVLLFVFTGCADDSVDNAADNGGGSVQITPEQAAIVDNAFYEEYKKQVTEAPAKFSVNAEANIKSLIQNMTGRGMMPSNAGIGVLKETNVASAAGKTIVETFLKDNKTIPNTTYIFTQYKILDTDAVTFLGAVTGAMLKNPEAKKLIDSLKLYTANQTAIELLVKEHVNRFGANKVKANGYVNLAYFYASLTSYFGQLKISKLPEDAATVKKVVDVVYNQCKGVPGDKNTVDTFNGETPAFTVMPILSCGKGAAGMQHMVSFMNKLGKIFDPNYTYPMPSMPPMPPKPGK